MKNKRRKAGTGENEKKKKDHKTNKLLIHLYACKEWFPYGF